MKTPPITEREETDVYREILNLYVGSDPLRPAMHTPFFQDEYVLATDAHLMICFAANRLKTIDFTPLENTPNALKVLTDVKNNCNVEFETIELRKAINFCNQIFKDTYQVVDIKCPDCKDEGWVFYEFEDYKGIVHRHEYICPTCDEKNIWQAFVNKKNGKVIEDDVNLYIKINESHFAVQFFERLVLTAEKLGAQNITHVYEYGKYSANKFLIHDTMVLIMPTNNEVRDYDIVTTVNQPSIS